MKSQAWNPLYEGLLAIGWLTLLGLAAGLPAGAEPLLQGRVRLASGEPLSAAQVRLFRLTDLHQLAGTTTDGTGYFALPLEATEEASALPDRFHLGQNYPNPFNPSTIIPYRLPASTHVRLEVFNLLGQRVTTLVDAVQSAGFHGARWDGTDATGRAVAAGVYLYRLQSDHARSTRRMVLLDGQAGIAAAALEAAPTNVQRLVEPGTPPYGLTISGQEIVTYIDAEFRIARDGGPVEVVVEALESAHRRKVATSGLLGDVNNDGQVDITDALIVVVYSLDLNLSITVPNNGDISLGDLNRDGRVDIADALLILTYLTDPSDPSLPEGIGEPIAPIVGTPKMYWTGHDIKKIRRANLDGSSIEDLVSTGHFSAGIALDVAGGKIYWTDQGSASIHRANLDGSNVQDLVSPEVGSINCLALDVADGKMYWTNAEKRKIQRANLDGSDLQDLITLGAIPHGLALDVAEGKMYWTAPRANWILRANLDGSNFERIFRPPPSNQEMVGRPAGTNVNSILYKSPRNPTGLALDLAGRKMYWTEPKSLLTLWSRIRRANLDGSRIEDLIIRGLSVPRGLALDVAGGKMYWTDLGRHKIQRANLDGSKVEDLVTSGLRRPWGLALDLSRRD